MRDKTGAQVVVVNQQHKKSKPKTALIWLILIVAMAALLFYGLGGWYFSGQLDKLALSGAARRSLTPTYSIPIAAVTPESITLNISSSTPKEANQSGTWGLEWPSGYGQISTIVQQSPNAVERVFHLVTGSLPAVGQKAAIDVDAYPDNPITALGVKYTNVYYNGPLGKYPAWFIPGAKSTWAITVHGNGMTRLDGMKILPVLHQMGLPVLMITYRNDPGAPESKSDTLRYGLTEWQDLQASVNYALSHGAHHVVLLGYSMGGAVVINFMYKSPLAKDVSAVVLDAPLLNFSTTVNFGASQMDLPLVGLPLPQSLTDVAKWMATVRYGVEWGQLNYLSKDKQLKTPILLFQGLGDKTVPPSTSNALARDRPHLVTYITTNGAGHLESWNFHPFRYDTEVGNFLAKFVA